MASFLDSLFDDEERQPLSVSELTAQVRGALELRFGSVWVEGEISNFHPSSAGHWYFTVKDENAQLRAACFRNVNARLRFRPANGLLMRLRGRVTVYDPRGEYQLTVESLEPVGAGALQLAYQQLRDKLEREGLFAEDLKRPLPVLPRRVAVVTSPTGAAVQDMLRILTQRTRTVDIVLAPTRVQGTGAAREIARAIEKLNQLHARAVREKRHAEQIDVIIIGRGGGSAEDLWAFNEEILARAVRASAIPIISAVGHESDYTIADLVADVRAPTPTAAATMVAEQEDALTEYLAKLQQQMAQTVRYQLLEARQQLHEAAFAPVFDEVRRRLQRTQQRHDEAAQRLANAARQCVQTAERRARAVTAQLSAAAVQPKVAVARLRQQDLKARHAAAMQARLAQARQHLATQAAALDALSPLAVLQRGYAVATNEQGELLHDARAARLRERVRVRLARGALLCRVEETETF